MHRRTSLRPILENEPLTPEQVDSALQHMASEIKGLAATSASFEDMFTQLVREASSDLSEPSKRLFSDLIWAHVDLLERHALELDRLLVAVERALGKPPGRRFA